MLNGRIRDSKVKIWFFIKIFDKTKNICVENFPSLGINI